MFVILYCAIAMLLTMFLMGGFVVIALILVSIRFIRFSNKGHCPNWLVLSGDTLLTGVDITTSRQNAQHYFAMRDGDEPTYILDIALLEHKLADQYARIQDPAIKGTVHELYSVLIGTIDVMIGLKGTGQRFYLEAMELFDDFLVLFTEDIDIRTLGLIPLDLNILENWEELGPGVSFYNIDIFEVQIGGMNYYNFITHSAISEEASPLDEFSQSISTSRGIAASLAAADSLHGPGH
jgi:hypothetical protein